MVKNTEATFADISLKELLLLALKQWRKILCVGIIFMILSGIFYFLYEKPKKAEQIKTLKTDITTLNSQMESVKDYYKDSVFYNLPNKFYQGSITFIVKGYVNGVLNDELSKSLIKAYLLPFTQDGSIYYEINNSLNKPYPIAYYLSEIISASYNNETYTFTIKVNHFNSSNANEIITIILKNLQNKQIIFNKELGTHDLIVVDKEVNNIYDSKVTMAVNKAVEDRNKIINELQNKQNELSKYESEKTLIKDLTIGLFGGMILAYLYFCINYLFSNKVKSANQIKYNYSANILGEFIKNKKSKFDKSISRKAGEPIDINLEDMRKTVAINITSIEPNIKNILVLSSKDVTETSELLSTISENNNLKDFSIEFAQNLPNSVEILDKISNTEAVIVVAKKLKTKLDELEKEFEIINNYNKKIIGVILVD